MYPQKWLNMFIRPARRSGHRILHVQVWSHGERCGKEIISATDWIEWEGEREYVRENWVKEIFQSCIDTYVSGKVTDFT